jgi:DnaJ-class molecular chaperone
MKAIIYYRKSTDRDDKQANSLAYHPDRNPDNEKLFTQITQKINEAYNYFKKHNKNG